MPTDLPRPALQLPSPPPLPAPEGFAARLEPLGVTLTEEQITRLGDYLARLLAMNEQMNLTSVTDPTEAWTRHIFDSLTLIPHLAPLGPGARLLDVGSGGGVPGIPLAIARPDLRITLLEATQKKATFLSAVVEALGCSQVTVENARAEQLSSSPLQGSFDAVTARAVARLDALLPWTAPFAKVGGCLLFIKGQKAAEELVEAKKMMGRFHCEHERTQETPTGRVVVLKRVAAKAGSPPREKPLRGKKK